MLSENYLINHHNFKRKQVNKKKMLIHKKYDITLIPDEETCGIFRNITDNSKYDDVGDIITLIGIKRVDEASTNFKNNKDELYLKHNSFKNTYIKNNQGDGLAFMTHERAKLLTEVIFNYMVSASYLTISNFGRTTYNKIGKCEYRFEKCCTSPGSTDNIIQLCLIYHYVDNTGNVYNYHTEYIYNYHEDYYTVNNRTRSYIPLDYLIKKFT